MNIDISNNGNKRKAYTKNRLSRAKRICISEPSRQPRLNDNAAYLSKLSSANIVEINSQMNSDCPLANVDNDSANWSRSSDGSLSDGLAKIDSTFIVGVGKVDRAEDKADEVCSEKVSEDKVVMPQRRLSTPCVKPYSGVMCIYNERQARLRSEGLNPDKDNQRILCNDKLDETYFPSSGVSQEVQLSSTNNKPNMQTIHQPVYSQRNQLVDSKQDIAQKSLTTSFRKISLRKKIKQIEIISSDENDSYDFVSDKKNKYFKKSRIPSSAQKISLRMKVKQMESISSDENDSYDFVSDMKNKYLKKSRIPPSAQKISLRVKVKQIESISSDENDSYDFVSDKKNKYFNKSRIPSSTRKISLRKKVKQMKIISSDENDLVSDIEVKKDKVSLYSSKKIEFKNPNKLLEDILESTIVLRSGKCIYLNTNNVKSPRKRYHRREDIKTKMNSSKFKNDYYHVSFEYQYIEC